MTENTTEELRLKLDNLLFLYWASLPEPKLSYGRWWLSEGGVKDMLDERHLEKV